MWEKTVKSAAELNHVREVSLSGTADLSFWKDWLKNEDLAPAERDGKAQILVVAADSKFKGVKFREVSFSVLVSNHEDGGRREAAFLVRAFNSSRFFAFCERVLFSTPYFHAGARVSAACPASIQLTMQNEVIFEAEMRAGDSATKREPSHSGEVGWAGPVYLPKVGRKKDRQGKLFLARIRGVTQTYPFLPEQDCVSMVQSQEDGIFRALVESGFAGREWAIREDATHAKSKTYARGEAFERLERASRDPNPRWSC
jgi:hypothetical protein